MPLAPNPFHKVQTCRACPGFGWEGYQAAPAGDPAQAKVLLVGEALGLQDVETGQPLSGKSGKWLTSLLRRHGVDRESVLVDGVLRCRPLDGIVKHARDNGALASCMTHPGHLAETASARSIQTLVAMGATAMQSLLGLQEYESLESHLGYPHWSLRFNKWVIPTYSPHYLFRGHQNLSGVFAQHIGKALRMAEGEVPLGFPETISDPSLLIAQQWLIEYQERLATGALLPLAVDIETPYKASKSAAGDGENAGVISVGDDPTFTILRVGFAYPGSTGLSLAWRSDYLGVIQGLLSAAKVWVSWNGSYDGPRLEANGMTLPEVEWDGMLAWHVINSDLPKGLGFVAPLLLNIPRWKHLGGSDPGKYNALDAIITIQLMMKLREDLVAGGFWTTFERHIVQLGTILAKMKHTGILLDQTGRQAVSEDLTAKLNAAAASLNEAVPESAKALDPKGGFAKTPKDLSGLASFAGIAKVRYCAHCDLREPKAAHFAKCGKPEKWNTRKQGKWPEKPREYTEQQEAITKYARLVSFVPSNQRMLAYAKSQHHKPVMKKDKSTGKVRPTFDDDALKALRVRYPEDLVYPLVDTYRDVEKERGFTGVRQADGTWKGGLPTDKAGRIHASLTHNPSSLRLSCVSPNLQQIKRTGPLRSLFVADPGYVLAEVDFSAIEAVLVGYFGGDKDYVRLAKLGVHDYLNSHILYRSGKLDAPVSVELPDADLAAALKDLKKRFPEEREIAKRTVHGSAYGMAAREMYRKNPEIYGSEANASTLRSVYMQTCPVIPRWQEATVLRAEEEAELRNPFGYLHRFWRICQYKQMPDGEWVREWAEDAKRSLSFIPQSTAAGIIKEAMLALEAEYQMASRGWLLLQIHDSLLFRFPEAEWQGWLSKVIEVMTRPILQLPLPWGAPGECLSIGVEAKQGLEWGKDPLRGKKGMMVWTPEK